MKKKVKILFVFLCLCLNSLEQENITYNLNLYNGLPSNHVYYSLVDTYGYLWLATTQGVIRYNGYSFKTYNLSDGMSNSDVWYLFQDNKKRIWPISISNNIGYIYNGKYKKIYIQDTDARLYPTNIINTTSGVAFSNLSRKDSKNAEVYYEHNDTLNNFSLKKYYSGLYYLSNSMQLIMNNDHNYYIANKKKSFFHVNEICKNTSTSYKKDDNVWLFIYSNYIIQYTPSILLPKGLSNKGLGALNFETCEQKTISLNKDERINVLSLLKQNLCIVTDKHIYVYDTSLRLVRSRCNLTFLKNKKIASTIVSYLENPLWGENVATTGHGYYIYYKQSAFKKAPYSLANYLFCGTAANSESYWWNKQNSTLSIIKDGKITSKKYKALADINKIIPYDKEKSLILTNNSILYLDNKTKKISNLFDYSNIFSKAKNWKSTVDESFKIHFYSIIKGIEIDNDFYCLLPNLFIDYKYDNSNLYTIALDKNKYKDLLYDTASRNLFAYGNYRILVYNIISKKKAYIEKKELDGYGISKIENIIIDKKYGNIFLKDYDHFFVFNYNTFTYRQLFKNYALQDVSFQLKNDILVATGKFGIFFSKIKNALSVTKPLVYKNFKCVVYENINDVSVQKNEVTLNTDKGTFIVQVPTDKEIENNTCNLLTDNYKLVCTNKDSVTNIASGDTILIKQPVTPISFDLINPTGNGTVKYSSRIAGIDSGLHELNSNELSPDILMPGKYYTLSLLLSDDVWKSPSINITLYVLPYWWQTSLGKSLLWIAGSIILILIIVLSAYIAKKIQIRKNEKNNLQSALELKAVYAQLNPHFIFNSLNLTQYLISKNKLDLAYSHISKFSSLLRSYLKSSRNRYICIEEECTNLKNYIELQQMRFDNLFFYEIIIDPHIAQKATYIPALLIQPIVENAINHGLIPNGTGGHLRIEFSIKKENNTIVCYIDDNGIGRKNSVKMHEVQKPLNESYGTSLTNELVNIFNRYERTGINLSYIDKEMPQKGTLVRIEIKNPLYQ